MGCFSLSEAQVKLYHLKALEESLLSWEVEGEAEACFCQNVNTGLWRCFQTRPLCECLLVSRQRGYCSGKSWILGEQNNVQLCTLPETFASNLAKLVLFAEPDFSSACLFVQNVCLCCEDQSNLWKYVRGKVSEIVSEFKCDNNFFGEKQKMF